jgi:hypothetical protein
LTFRIREGWPTGRNRFRDRKANKMTQKRFTNIVVAGLVAGLSTMPLLAQGTSGGATSGGTTSGGTTSGGASQ